MLPVDGRQDPCIQRTKGMPKPKDPVFTFRATPAVEEAVEAQLEHLTRNAPPGLSVRRTDAIASLILLGAMARAAALRVQPYGPQDVINAGEQALSQELQRFPRSK
jgi:hypothetical protein